VIYLHTGQPGAGKSLFTIAEVMERATKEGRAVFYSGIADCKVAGWVELQDATNWESCPDGAIIVIDEAQRVFRPRHAASSVPPYVAALETHRHRGFDIYVITQHPSLVETNVRRLVGTHRHVMRAFGSHAAVIHEWNEVRADCDTKRDGSISRTWRYPKAAFQLYKSAEVHTHRARVPLRVWLVLASPILLGLIGWSLYQWVSGRMDGERAAARVASSAGQSGVSARAQSGQAKVGERNDAAKWVQERTARVQGLHYSAPVYDAITKPVTAPFPAMCIKSATRCLCYSQQGTRLDVAAEMCGQLVERGFFRDWVDGGERSGIGVAAPSGAAEGVRRVAPTPSVELMAGRSVAVPVGQAVTR
jgi:hypothetical protein